MNTRSELTQSQVGTAHKGLGVPDEMIWQKSWGTRRTKCLPSGVKRRDQAMQVAAIAASLRQSPQCHASSNASTAKPGAFTEGNHERTNHDYCVEAHVWGARQYQPGDAMTIVCAIVRERC